LQTKSSFTFEKENQLILDEKLLVVKEINSKTSTFEKFDRKRGG